MAPRKVLHISNVDLGLRIHMRNQMRYIRDHGFDVWGVCSPGPLIPKDEENSDHIKIKTIPMTQRITPVQDFVSLVRLYRFIRREHFDVVHTHSLKGGMLGRIAARLAGVPVIIHTVHGFYFHDEMPPRQRAFWKAVERVGMRFGHYALSQNQEDVETATNERICRSGRIRFLGNGINLDEFDPGQFSDGRRRAKRAELAVPENAKIVAISGRLVVEKGYQEFIEAASIIRQQRSDVFFWAMGASQPDRQNTISGVLFEDPELENSVTFLGMRSDMPELYAAMDVFVLPSHGREGVPRVLIEAATMGLPLVATNVRGCREVVIDGKTGLLVPPRDSEALTKAILRLLDDESLAKQLGRAAREHALERFDEVVTFERIVSVYEHLLENAEK